MSKPKIAEPEVRVDGLRVSTYMLLGASLILFVFSLFMWNKFVLGSDRRIFESALYKSLATSGVTISSDGSDDQALRTSTLKLDLAGDLGAETRSEFKNESIHTIIKTVSDKTKDYLYYEKNQHTETPRLQEFEGTWVDISSPDQTESKTLADQLTNGSMVFIANFSTSDRKEFIRLLEDEAVYTIESVAATREIEGQEQRVYKVRLNTIGFNKALRSYLETIGLTEAAASVSESSATESLQPTIEIALNPKTKKIGKVGFPDLDSIGARTYSDWGANYSFELPTESISADQLQEKLDSIYTPVSE